jgi:GAF domain-containing protein
MSRTCYRYMSSSETTQKQKKQVSKQENKMDEESEKVAEPTFVQLRRHALNAAIPMIGFGLMDQMIMIQAGDAIDRTLGVSLGLSTLVAAGMGQVLSDTSGVLFGGVVESAAMKLGLPASGLSAAQMRLRRVKLVETFAAALGVICGCLLGMVSLLFMDLEKSERLKKQQELAAQFEEMLKHGQTVLSVEHCRLWLATGDGAHIYSKAAVENQLNDPSESELRATFDSFDLDHNKTLSAAEVHTGLINLGFDVTMSSVRAEMALQLASNDADSELDYKQFKALVHHFRHSPEIRMQVKHGSLVEHLLAAQAPLIVDDVAQEPRYDAESVRFAGSGSGGTVSLLMVPIANLSDSEGANPALGFIEMHNKIEEGRIIAFAVEDLRVAQLLARAAAAFIQQAYGSESL